MLTHKLGHLAHRAHIKANCGKPSAQEEIIHLWVLHLQPKNQVRILQNITTSHADTYNPSSRKQCSIFLYVKLKKIS